MHRATRYHSRRLATDARWGQVYREGRAAAAVRYGLGYGAAGGVEPAPCEGDDEPTQGVIPLDRWRTSPARLGRPGGS